MQTPFRAAIFDLDGTLLDTLPGIQTSLNLLLTERYGVHPLSAPAVRRAIGNGARMLVLRALRASGIAADAEIDSALASYLEYFREHCLDGLAPYPGIPALLGDLQARRIPVAVLTNKPQEMTELSLARCFPRGSFRYILGEIAGRPRKPSPAGANALAYLFGAAPEECLYVGDSETDLETARNAGMFACAVTWGYRDRAELAVMQPDMLVDSPADISALVLGR